MLLGVLLALAAGTIVIYIVSTATSTGPQMITVVVAKVDLDPNTILTVTPQKNTPTAKYMLISDAFEAKQVPVDVAPENAYKWISELDLETKLNNYVVGQSIYQGDYLRNPDRRLSLLGVCPSGSLTCINPGALKDGQVLFAVDVHGPGGASAKPFAVAGDYVDFIFIECQLPGSKDPQGCEAQTTLKGLLVYAVTESQIIVAVTHQQAVEILYLVSTGAGEMAIRRPSDNTDSVSTLEVDKAYIVKNFGY